MRPMRTFFIAFTLGILVGSIVTAYLSAPDAYVELKLAKSRLFGTPLPSEEVPLDPTPQPDQPETSEAVESLPGVTQSPDATPDSPPADAEALPPSESYPLAAPKSAPDATPAASPDEPEAPASSAEPETEDDPEPDSDPESEPGPDPEPTIDPTPPNTPTPTPPGPPPEQPETPDSVPENEPEEPDTKPETGNNDAREREESLGDKAQRAIDSGKDKAAQLSETATRTAQELKKQAEPLIDESVDLAIATAIRAQYKLERRVDADAIDIVVKNRQVTLSGAVPNKEMKQLAIEIAMSTKGVAQVAPQKLEISE